jgi:hypothetical protein
VEDIAHSVFEATGKSKAEAARYHSVFWKRYKEVEGWEKVVDRVEKGEQKIARREVCAACVLALVRAPCLTRPATARRSLPTC